MSEILATEDFQEPMLQVGMDAVARVKKLADSEGRLAVPQTRAVSWIEERTGDSGAVASVIDEYHSTAIDRVHPGHFNRTDQSPATYLANILHIFAEALVESSTNQDIGAGAQPIFPPAKKWLNEQIKSVWLTIPKQPVEHFTTVPIFTVSARTIFPISLSLMHYEDEESWEIGYVTKHHRALVWGVFVSMPGEVTVAE
jgi:hypothetical protein